MEIIADTALLAVVREEVDSACEFSSTGDLVRLDAGKIVSLPLLQSIYTEIMRLHISYVPSRKVLQPVVVDGYTIPQGSLLQTHSEMAHRSEEVWGTEEHPASSFWAFRHISNETTDGAMQFSIKGRSGAFFPYGMQTCRVYLHAYCYVSQVRASS